MAVYFFAVLNFYLSIIILFFNVKINKNAFFLAGYLFCLGLFGIVHNFTFDEKNPLLLALVRGYTTPIHYALGPMLYLYVRGTVLDKYVFKKSDFWHFLPMLISVLSLIPFYFTSFSYKLEIARNIQINPRTSINDSVYWIIPHFTHFYIRAISFLGYSIASLLIVLKASKILENRSVPKPQKKLILRWLYTLTILSAVIFICYVPLTFYLLKIVKLPFVITETAYNIFDRITGYSYCVIPLTVLVLPQILYGLPVAAKTKLNPKPTDFWEDTQAILEEDPFLDVSKKILAYLKNEKPYLNPDFNMDTIAEKLKIPKHHIYYCFGNIIKIKFSKVRNRLRVDHAKKLLLEEKLQNLKLEAIGFESGFSSRSHFFATFKEETGLTPSEFIIQSRSSE